MRHFFHNLTNLRIGYLTQEKNNNSLDIDWIESYKCKKETTYLKWIQLKEPLAMHIDGSSGKGLILKKEVQQVDFINEDESSGI